MRARERAEREAVVLRAFGEGNFTINPKKEIEARTPKRGWYFVGWLDDDSTLDEIRSRPPFDLRKQQQQQQQEA